MTRSPPAGVGEVTNMGHREKTSEMDSKTATEIFETVAGTEEFGDAVYVSLESLTQLTSEFFPGVHHDTAMCISLEIAVTNVAGLLAFFPPDVAQAWSERLEFHLTLMRKLNAESDREDNDKLS